MKLKYIFFIGYGVVILGLLLYSYTQVDLSLTLSRASIYQTVEKGFQYIGWYQRPLSTVLYLILITALCIFYGIMLKFHTALGITRKNIWYLIMFTVILLTVSYNAFSYDLFNYIFDAKIITHYHQNPYLHKALDYPHDPMLSFMRWTHRTYPYGPVWIILTVPFSLLGLGYFLPTFFLFKFLMSGMYLGSVYVVAKIVRRLQLKDENFYLMLFALNPLVIIESIISAHNDIVTAFFGLIAFYFLLNKKYWWSLLFLSASIGIKFDTLFLLPVFLYAIFQQRRKKEIQWENIFLWSSICMFLAILVATYRSNFQPWYILFTLPYMIYIGKKYYVFVPIIILTVLSLLQYAPYIYFGDYNYPVYSLLAWLTYGSWVLSLLVIFFWYLLNRLLWNASHGTITDR